MSKTLLNRLFGLGNVPKGALAQIRREGVVLKEEGISGSVTLRNFRKPGRYNSYYRSWFSGSIVLTEQHLLVFKLFEPVVGIAWDDEKFENLDVQLESDGKLCIALEASDFDDKSSGTVEVRLSTPLASQIQQEIKKRGS